MLNKRKADAESSMNYIQQVLKRHPMSEANILTCNIKEQIWLILAKYSFKNACIIRNKLKVGF